MEGFNIRLTGWEDGQQVRSSAMPLVTREPQVDQKLEVTDRWTIHAADEVEITVSDITIRVKQEPHALGAARIGVGACVWEGEMLLAAYLASLPRHRYIGARAVELGAGPGLAGMVLAKMGANVVVTDKACVLPLMRDNLALNGLLREQRKGAVHGYAEAAELEWGADGAEDRAAVLAHDPLDWVVAADCVYIDNEGQSPSTAHFIRTCFILCSGAKRPTCLVSFELRSSQVKQVFLEEANNIFSKVTRIPPHALPKGCQVEHIELYELTA